MHWVKRKSLSGRAKERGKERRESDTFERCRGKEVKKKSHERRGREDEEKKSSQDRAESRGLSSYPLSWDTLTQVVCYKNGRRTEGKAREPPSALSSGIDAQAGRRTFRGGQNSSFCLAPSCVLHRRRGSRRRKRR